MGDINQGVEQLIEWVLIDGLQDQVDLGFIHQMSFELYDPIERKGAVLEFVRRVLSEGLMVVTSPVDGEYVPYEAGVEELVEMIATNYPYDDDGVGRRDELLFLYWMVNTEKGNEKAKSLL